MLNTNEDEMVQLKLGLKVPPSIPKIWSKEEILDNLSRLDKHGDEWVRRAIKKIYAYQLEEEKIHLIILKRFIVSIWIVELIVGNMLKMNFVILEF